MTIRDLIVLFKNQSTSTITINLFNKPLLIRIITPRKPIKKKKLHFATFPKIDTRKKLIKFLNFFNPVMSYITMFIAGPRKLRRYFIGNPIITIVFMGVENSGNLSIEKHS